MGQLLEAIMIISFGFSWPISLLKSWRSRTAKGKSMMFTILILFGYLCGILSKFAGKNITYVLVFYCLNFIFVFGDLLLYFRNKKLDEQAARAALN
ncbi:MAG: hypothetical protein FWF85_10180 [Clostridiales bacterium]|nr:hypothetical protein [Clostridiales bacterium]